MEKKEVTAEIVKGCARHGTVKGHRERVEFVEMDGAGVRVEFERFSLWISGNRKYLPACQPGEEYNLHAGDPTRKTRIKILG